VKRSSSRQLLCNLISIYCATDRFFNSL
jgi:hypothetical protein